MLDQTGHPASVMECPNPSVTIIFKDTIGQIFVLKHRHKTIIIPFLS